MILWKLTGGRQRNGSGPRADESEQGGSGPAEAAEGAGQQQASQGPGTAHGRLIPHTLNVCSFPSHEATLVTIGGFLAEGLYGDERVALVAFENVSLTIAEFARLGWDFDSAIASERLVYLYYRPVFAQALSLTADYEALFAELKRLTGKVSRLALLNAELLFNLQSQHLSNLSASKLAATRIADGLTVLAGYTRQDDPSFHWLDTSCASVMLSYFEVEDSADAPASPYVFKPRGKLPGAV